jgi:DNA replication protein DnaC
MGFQDFLESNDEEEIRDSFISIPKKKLLDCIDEIKSMPGFAISGVLTQAGSQIVSAMQRYYKANIPVDYWLRDMAGFEGDKSLVKVFQDFTKDLKKSYSGGKSICLIGKHGSGKSMTISCILKNIVENNRYTALYTNMTDIIHAMVNPDYITKDEARRKYTEIDFLAIDEVDHRLMGTDNAADFFGRVLEPIVRCRIQNKLPVLMCTNSDVSESFTGPLKQSFDSLMALIPKHTLLPGKDYRKKNTKKVVEGINEQ